MLVADLPVQSHVWPIEVIGEARFPHTGIKSTGLQHLESIFDPRLIAVDLHINVRGNDQVICCRANQDRRAKNAPPLEEPQFRDDFLGNEQPLCCPGNSIHFV